MKMRRLVSLLFVVSSLAVAASAQVRVQAGSSFPTPKLAETGTAFLLVPQVQKELHIAPALASKISAAYMQSMRSMMPASKNGATKDPVARQKAFREGYKEVLKNQAKIVEMLNPAQKARLRQISIQQLGARAMVHPEIKPILKLTPDEERKINAILRDGTQLMLKSVQTTPGKTPSSADWKAKMSQFQSKQAEWRVKMIDLSLKVLTPAQRSQWQSLCGKPFTFDYSGLNMFRAPKGGK